MSSINANLSDDIITKNVFSAWMPHGVAPNQQNYAYTIVPGISSIDALEEYNPNVIQILENSAKIQAVQHTELDMLQIVFYQKGSFNNQGISITVDQPTVLIVKDISTEQVTIIASDPTQTQEYLSIDYASASIQPSRRITLNLPIRSSAGSSIKAFLNNYSPLSIEAQSPIETLEILPLADSWVRSHNYDNYGRSSYLKVGGKTTDIHKAYLKFSLKGIHQSIKKATLRLYNQNDNVSGTWNLQIANHHAWTEGTGNETENTSDGITWHNAPDTKGMVDSFTKRISKGYVDFDLTSLTQYLDQDSVLSLQLSANSTLPISIASKENPLSTTRPRLIIHTSPQNKATEAQRIPILEDTFVRGGNYSNDKYGSAKTLIIKKDALPAYEREIFVKVDFSTITYHVNAVTLKFHVGYAGTTIHQTKWELYSVNNSDWSQKTLSWNTKPLSEFYVGSVYGCSSGGYIEFDLTEYYHYISRQQSNTRANSFVHSFKIVSTVASSDGYATFSSLEATDTDLRPVLITYVEEDKTPLPVQFISIKGNRLTDGSVHLEWRTTNEINHYQFEVERSIDGNIFQHIGTVKNATSTAGHETIYQFEDREFAKYYPEVLYYRLKQIDLSGEWQHSPIIAVEAQSVINLSLWPNPTTGVITVDLPTSPSSPITLQLVNSVGSVVKHYQLHSKSTKIGVKDLHKGLYLGKFFLPSGRVETRKILFQ